MRKPKFKIGEMKPRCRYCRERVSPFIQDQHAHMMRYHLDELNGEFNQSELELFKKGFIWEPSTSSLQP